MAIGLGVNIQKKTQTLAGPVRDAIVDGNHADLLLDFNSDYYLANGGKKPLDEVLTHSRSGNATMVDSDGLIKWAPHNLLQRSEEFNNAAWTKFKTTAPATQYLSPAGTTTAESLLETANTSGHSVYQSSVTTSGAVYTVSIYVKPNGRDFAFVRTSDSVGSTNLHGVSVDLIGVTASSAVGSPANIVCVSAPNGFVRVSFSFVAVATARLEVITSTDGVYANRSYTGDITKGLFVWGAHLYRSDLGGMVDVPAGERVIPSASTYVPTTSSARYLPRVGHHVYNGSAWVNEGLLVESEARTNLIAESENINATGWNIGRATVSLNQTTAPDGNTTADKLTESTATGSHYALSPGVSASNGQTFTVSGFFKKDTKGYAAVSLEVRTSSSFLGALNLIFNIETGAFVATEPAGTAPTLVSYASQDYGNGWYRLSVTGTTNSASTNEVKANYLTADASGTVSFTGSTSNSIYIWGTQLEEAPTPSSYIPTAGATVTRAAETFTIPAANLPWSGTAVSIQMNGRMTYADTDNSREADLYFWSKDSNNDIRTSLNTGSTNTGNIQFLQREAATVDFVITGGVYSPGILVPFNIASRHGSTFINGAVDGVALTANTTPTNLPDLSTTDLDLAYTFMGTVERFRIWDVDLGDGGIEGASS